MMQQDPNNHHHSNIMVDMVEDQKDPHLVAMVPSIDEEALQLYSYVLDADSKKALIDLQSKWLSDLQMSREKLLVEMTEKLHQEFLSDQQKIRTDLLTSFKEELDAVKAEMELRHKENFRIEAAKVTERQKQELSKIKKKQWCWMCEKEAIYHCCWNTSYCSVECQQGHWQTHRKYCRRKKNTPSGPGLSGNPGGPGESNGEQE